MKNHLYKFLFSFVFVITSLCIADDTDFQPPTQRFLENNSSDSLWVKLEERNVRKELIPYFLSIISQETLGFAGYHASMLSFRVLQDIIRISIEEILEIPVRPDFQFLRVPGDPDLNIESTADFFSRHEIINNEGPLKSKQLLSMNIPLFASYSSKTSCTICYFANNSSKHQENVQVKSMATTFFERLGASPQDAKDYANEMEKLSSKLQSDYGVLLQIYDMSHEKTQGRPYVFFDDIAYACRGKGRPIEDFIPSTHLLYDSKEFPQIRLIMSNYSTLNPYSPLVIKRYDFLDPEIVAEWESELRALIRTMPIDVMIKEQFKEELLEAWNHYY